MPWGGVYFVLDGVDPLKQAVDAGRRIDLWEHATLVFALHQLLEQSLLRAESSGDHAVAVAGVIGDLGG